MPFEIAKPISKAEFLAVYKDSVGVTQLIFAPFGLTTSIVDILGGSKALEVYTLMFQQWEDLVSKRVFTSRGFNDDRIIASMHKFIGKTQDADIVSEVRSASEALSYMLKSPTVVEFDFPKIIVDERTVELCTATTAAKLLDKVITVLKELYIGDSSSQSGVSTDSTVDIDVDVFDAFQITLSSHIFNPSRHYGGKASKVSQRMSTPEFINRLRHALVLTKAELLSPDQLAVTSTDVPSVTYSLQQYYAMLDIFATSPEVVAVLTSHCGVPTSSEPVDISSNETKKKEVTLLEAVRTGRHLSHLNHASTHPIVAYIEQLTALAPHSTITTTHIPVPETTKPEEKDETAPDSESVRETSEVEDTPLEAAEKQSDSDEDEDDDEVSPTETVDVTAIEEVTSLTPEQVEQVQCSLDLALTAVRLIGEAKAASTIGDLDAAIDCISQVINKCRNGDDDEEEKDEKEEEKEVEVEAQLGELSSEEEKEQNNAKLNKYILPVFLKVLLYTDRATYYAEQYELADALEDINVAIALDPFNQEAYSLRSQIATAQLQQQAEEAESDDEEEDTYRNAYERMMYGGKKKNTKKEKKDKVVSEVVTGVTMVTAAEDALAAFLLGGCSDIELAAAAEETAREQCRLTAKDIFRDRLKPSAAPTSQLPDVTDGVGVSDICIDESPPAAAMYDNLPRSWLVGSYYSGYTLLSEALEVHPSEEEELEMKKKGVVGKANLNDICEEESESVSQLARPPAHLLDTPTIVQQATIATTEDSEHDIDESTPTISADESTSSDGLQQLDREGYALLVQVVEAMEAATYSSKNNTAELVISAENHHAHQIDEEEEDDETHSAHIVYEIAFSAAESCLLDDVDQHREAYRLVEEGICDDNEEEREGEHTYVSPGDKNLKHVKVGTVSAAVEVDLNVETAVTTDVVNAVIEEFPSVLNGVPIGLPCPHFLSALALLTSTQAHELTGVHMNADGTIASIDYDTFKSGCREEEHEQDDDHSDEDEDEEEEHNYHRERLTENNEEDEEEEKTEYARKSNKKTSKKSHDSVDKKHPHGKKAAKKGKRTSNTHKRKDRGDPDYYSEQYQHDENEDGEHLQGNFMTDDDLFDFMAKAAANGTGPTKMRRNFLESDDDEEEEDEDEEEGEAGWNINDMSFDSQDDEDDSDEDYEEGDSESDSEEEEENDSDEEEEEEEEPRSRVGQKEPLKKTGAISPPPATPDTTPSVVKSKPATSEEEEEEEEEAEGVWEDCDDEDEEEDIDSITRDLLNAAAELADDDEEGDEGDWEDCSDEDNEEGEESQNEVEAALQELIQMAGECDLGPTMCVPCARPEDSMPSNKVVVSESAIDVPSDVETTAPTIVLPDIKLSHKLRARLLNVCGSVAYLAGDATGAVACLRASLLEDPSLVDSKIKLGSLLIDMDESTEASRLLKEAKKSDPDNAVVVLHLGELLINKNEFERAVKHLRKVQRLVPFYQSNRSAKGVSERDRMQRVSVEDIQANATALLGISLFRLNPTRPDIAISVLEEGLSEHPNSIILLICSGEVHSQAGDMVNALENFERANKLDARNPLPFVNAARTYQQLGQLGTASSHLQHAINLDPALSMTRVDLAQNYMQSGRTEDALDMLNVALSLARQVSEIRDVLTAKSVATMQLKLEKQGLYIPASSSV